MGEGPTTASPPTSVLLVDDDDATRYALGRVLGKMGFLVREAASGVEALSAAAASPCEVVLLDVNLPDLDGFEVCRRLRAHPATAGSAIIHLTGARLADADRVRGLESGADSYLTHPVEPTVVAATVNAVLRARRAEARAQEREARLRFVIERMPAILWTTDASLRFTSVLGAGLAAAGLEPASLVGRALPDGFGTAARSRSAVEACERTLRGDATRWTQEVAGRSFSMVAEPLRGPDGAVTGMAGVALDVTEQRAAERACAESEERFRGTFEQAAVGIGHVAPDGRWLRVNGKLCEITGYSREELLARSVRDITHQDDVEPDLSAARRLLAGEIATYTREKRYVRKDGSLVWVELTVSLARDAAGAPEYLISVTVGISSRKKAEEALRKSEAQLRQAQKMEAVGRLAGGVAHDFNNVLTAITGHSELALMELREDDPLRHGLEVIRKSGQRAAALTRQLLAFSRKQALVPAVLDLNRVVADVERLLRRLIGEDVELRTDLDPKTGTILADAGQLEQVLMNLAVNARDAMPTGGTLAVSTAGVELDGATAARLEVRPGPHVRLSVADTGCGMGEEVLSHLFEPFFTTKERGKGTGLGLAIVYGIVKQSSGGIEVESAPGRGTTFRIYLPRAAGSGATPPDAAPPATETLRGTETVLLVEDEDVVRELARRVLEAHGYRVIAARGPGEALLECERRRDPIPLVVTDVVMPQMNGRELAERLARQKGAIKVLYMSGYTAGILAEHGVSDEGRAFLQKPFTPDGLLRAVRKALG